MRYISMKHFRSPAAVKRCALNRETIVLGQILGEVNGHLKKMARLPDGSESESIVLLGDFAGVCYETQARLMADGKDGNEAEMTAESLYMPRWFAEAVVARLGNNARIEFAAEILILPTTEGSTVMYQYDVRSLIARPANSPVERMKRVLAQKGILRLSAPVAEDAPAISVDKHAPALAQASDADPAEAAGDAPEPTGDDDVAAETHDASKKPSNKHKK